MCVEHRRKLVRLEVHNGIFIAKQVVSVNFYSQCYYRTDRNDLEMFTKIWQMPLGCGFKETNKHLF